MTNDDRVSLNSKQKYNGVKGSNSPHGDALSSSPLPSFDMYRGYFPLWRKIVDWGWYKEGNTARVFIHLLLKANREKKHYLGHVIKAGQVVTGRKKLSVELGLSEQQIRTAINHLKSTNEVTSTSHRHFSILTLNNWEKYLPKNYLNNKKLTSNQPAPNQLLTTTNKDNKEEKDKKYRETYSKIVSHLNTKTNSSYKDTTSKTRQLIRARLREGFTVKDFYSVIDTKTEQWLNNKDMAPYLRPETLFGTKFEGYLNEKKPKKGDMNAL